jgi:phospholipid/cholesterol/gamma-HCH transport system substrate-binding protein
MSADRKGTEFFAGLFLIVGFGILAGVILMFGRFGGGIKRLYPITVEFPNAGGLVKGCDVLLSGARIGTVSEPPRLTGKAFTVAAQMKINERIQIPRGSTFLIRTNGMLGDSFVDVVPPADFNPEEVIQPGETVPGSQTGGLDSLIAKGGKLMDTLNEEVLRKLNLELDEIQVATRAVNKNLLSEQNLKNLQDTFANLKKTTDQFAEASKHLDAVVAKTGEAVDSAKGTLKTVDGAASDVRLAIVDIRKMTDSANLLVKKATTGEGTLGTLISDKETADDLKALIANLRRSGVLFYKDRPVDGAQPPRAATPPPRPRGR